MGDGVVVWWCGGERWRWVVVGDGGVVVWCAAGQVLGGFSCRRQMLEGSCGQLVGCWLSG